MIICPNCGKESRDDARFCDQCGYELKKKDDTLTVVLKIILGILGGIILAAVLLIVSMTLVGLILYLFLLMMIQARNPVTFGIILTLIFMIPVFLSIPYWKKVFTQARSEKNRAGYVAKAALKWFLKGPLAYK